MVFQSLFFLRLHLELKGKHEKLLDASPKNFGVVTTAGQECSVRLHFP